MRWWLQNGGNSEGWPTGFEGGIAHRLDTRTDGLMVVARTPEMLLELRREFSEGLLRKFYRFESNGDVPFRKQRCTLPIAHHARKSDRMVVQKGHQSRHRGKWYPAWTEFCWLEANTWQAEIRTGVMHQIRVHAAALGLPLDGDTIYGGAEGEFRLQHIGIKAEGWSFFLPV